MPELPPLVFHRAVLADLDEICALVTAAVAELDRRGIPQWDSLYPTREDVRADMEKGQLYLTRQDGAAAAVFTLNAQADPDYAAGAWQHPGLPFGVLHRLCVHPDLQRRGLGKRSVLAAEALLRSRGGRVMRLDVFTQNPFSQRMYRALGYQTVGQVRWRKGVFDLMEKRL